MSTSESRGNIRSNQRPLAISGTPSSARSVAICSSLEISSALWSCSASANSSWSTSMAWRMRASLRASSLTLTQSRYLSCGTTATTSREYSPLAAHIGLSCRLTACSDLRGRRYLAHAWASSSLLLPSDSTCSLVSVSIPSSIVMELCCRSRGRRGGGGPGVEAVQASGRACQHIHVAQHHGHHSNINGVGGVGECSIGRSAWPLKWMGLRALAVRGVTGALQDPRPTLNTDTAAAVVTVRGLHCRKLDQTVCSRYFAPHRPSDVPGGLGR
mmetsp:Transcript_25062/g.75537  ORF Transcript_25062/g.75537 Transcript_25062/m.75537 type:complete len:271 (+) Transcript_25062:957-1769(+)